MLCFDWSIIVSGLCTCMYRTYNTLVRVHHYEYSCDAACTLLLCTCAITVMNTIILWDRGIAEGIFPIQVVTCLEATCIAYAMGWQCVEYKV